MLIKAEFTTVEEGKEVLKKHVSIRDEMGGAMYWNALNDECCTIANKLKDIGANKDEISQILGEGTHSKPI